MFYLMPDKKQVIFIYYMIQKKIIFISKQICPSWRCRGGGRVAVAARRRRQLF
jgi:hypothetical protein